MGERLNDWHAAAKLVKKIAYNYKLPYYTLSPTYSICPEHGYLNGEQYECPKCHQKTEVYSRITGYYRPVQNWNDGKLQEFKQRKLYAVGANFANTQKLAVHTANGEQKTVPHVAAAAVKTQVQAAAEANQNEGNQLLLFTTRTCPNCKAAKDMLQKAGLAYTTVVAEEKPELAEQYGIQMAPTIVVMKDNQPTRITGLADIRHMVEQTQN